MVLGRRAKEFDDHLVSFIIYLQWHGSRASRQSEYMCCVRVCKCVYAVDYTSIVESVKTLAGIHSAADTSND